MANYNFKIVYRPGICSGEPDALSRRREYCPEEGARCDEHTILKLEHFQISVIYQKRASQKGLEPTKPKPDALRVRRLTEKATTSTKGSCFAAGHNIYAVRDWKVPAGGQMLVEMGIVIGLPEETYGRLAARSGMTSKMGIAVEGGVIDVDYTGEVKVILRNHGKADCLYKAGDRIAQLIIEKIANSDAMEVDDLETHSEVRRVSVLAI